MSELQKAVNLAPGSTRLKSSLAYAYAVSGRRAEARRILDELEELRKRRYVPGYHIAIIYVALGENDQAFEWLEKASEEYEKVIAVIKVAIVVASWT